MEVLPGTHLNGRLDAAAIAHMLEHCTPQMCLAERGEIVAMAPLTVHRLQRARSAKGWRVLHLEFSG